LNTTREAQVTRNLQVLAASMKQEFAAFIYEDERFTDLVHDLSAAFISERCPVISEDHEYDLALMLMETVKLTSY